MSVAKLRGVTESVNRFLIRQEVGLQAYVGYIPMSVAKLQCGTVGVNLILIRQVSSSSSST